MSETDKERLIINMEERILIKSKPCSLRFLKILPIVVISIAIGLFLIDFVPMYIEAIGPCDNRYHRNCVMWKCEDVNEYISSYSRPFTSAFDYAMRFTPMVLFEENFFYAFIVFPIIDGFVYFWLSGYELVVSDKRVYGKTAFARRVDLPADSISAVGMSIFKGLAVGTSSGRIYFLLIKNRDEIHAVISNLIIERQKQAIAMANNVSQKPQMSNADELIKYKELLDAGVILQDEFDAKKKQLLGL